MIAKPCIIITSLGRTGTKFFATFFGEIIPDSTALHEPDLFTTTELRRGGEGVGHLIEQLRDSGVINMVIRKPLGQWGVSKLADARVRGELERNEAARKVLNQRRQFVTSRPGSIYIESSTAYYGLIDVIADVYADHRLVYLVRDGRDWVRSWMSVGAKGGMYTKGKIRSLVAHTWPTAQELDHDEYSQQWVQMTRFEKLCWAWSRLNKYAMDTAKHNPNARVFRFEDVFLSSQRYEHLEELVSFVTAVGRPELFATRPLDGWLSRQIHKSEPAFPSWRNWSMKQRAQFDVICGVLMDELNYG